MKEVIDLLNEKNIPFELVEHEEVYTMEDMEKLGLAEKGIICKNLFVRDQKGKNHIVISVPHEKVVKLDDIGKKLGCGKLSFASKERLDKYLKLSQGYVSPFGFINDETKSVIFAFDKELMNKEKVGFHPNTNKATIFLKFNDLKKLIEEHDNDVIMIRL